MKKSELPFCFPYKIRLIAAQTTAEIEYAYVSNFTNPTPAYPSVNLMDKKARRCLSILIKSPSNGRRKHATYQFVATPWTNRHLHLGFVDNARPPLLNTICTNEKSTKTETFRNPLCKYSP